MRPSEDRRDSRELIALLTAFDAMRARGAHETSLLKPVATSIGIGVQTEKPSMTCLHSILAPLYRARLGVSANTHSVCVQGIAAALVEAGAAHARAARVQQLYVHVIAANAAGVGLYVQLGFAQEQAESEATARALGRPARLLLRRDLGEGVH